MSAERRVDFGQEEAVMVLGSLRPFLESSGGLGEFECRVQSFLDSAGQLSDLVSHRDKRIELCELRLEQAREDFVMARGAVSEVEAGVWDRTRPDWDDKSEIKKRIRVYCGNPKLRLPFVLGWVRRFGVVVHEDLAAFLSRVGEARARMEVVLSEVEEERGRIKKETGPDILRVDQMVRESARGLHMFCEESSRSSLDIAREYVKIFPERALSVVSGFVRSNASGPSYLRWFLGFAFDVGLFKQLRPGQIAQRYGRWFVEGRAPTPEEYGKMPVSVGEGWERYLVRRILAEWEDAGILKKGV